MRRCATTCLHSNDGKLEETATCGLRHRCIERSVTALHNALSLLAYLTAKAVLWNSFTTSCHFNRYNPCAPV